MPTAASRIPSPPEAPEAPAPASASPFDATAPLRPVDPDATAVLPTAPAAADTSVLPAPLVSGTSEPSVTDLHLFDGPAAAGPKTSGPGTLGGGTELPPRRRRGVLVAAAAAAGVGLIAAAGYLSGLFSYESPSRDTALPDGIRASVPDAPPTSAAPTPSASTPSAAPSSPAAASPSPSRSASPSPSGSPSPTGGSPSPSQSRAPSASPTTAAPTDRGGPENSGQNGLVTVLRRGDSGPEVTELQLRLRQLYLYNDDADGSYDQRLEDAVRTYQWSRGVQTDELGVYDRQTREKLEAETREP
ncbi:peptidoglycan-binding protein [Streptomyces sp. NPDC057838]|uniref:peptidoglycan-binding domain-containing protein n=1 Tax=unclassified Streptomyces TaxID=2593676 RepID=UPI0036CC4820